jgi:hypothetical protein
MYRVSGSVLPTEMIRVIQHTDNRLITLFTALSGECPLLVGQLIGALAFLVDILLLTCVVFVSQPLKGCRHWLKVICT